MWQIVTAAWRTTLAGLPVVGVVAAVNLVLGLIALPFVAGAGGQVSGPQAAVGLLLVLVQFFLLPFIQAGCVSFAIDRLKGTTSPALASFLQGAKRLYVKLLGFEALTVALLILLAFVSILLFGLSMLPNIQPGAGVALALVAAVPVSIGLYVLLLILSLGPVAIAVEGLGVFAAVKRALAVGRTAVGRLLLLTLGILATLIPVFLLTSLPDLLDRLGILLGMGNVVFALLLQSGAGALSMVLFIVAYTQLFRQRTNL